MNSEEWLRIHWQRIQEIFEEALKREPAARSLYLDEACAGDSALRAQVDSLVRSLDRAGDFLEQAAVETEDTDDLSVTGQLIGPYRIMEELGRGGMGAVYRAVRTGDYEQQVAIKLIQRGLDTEFVLRRFRAERQILAKLQHPGIAQLLDGGSTPDGRPYFVMECIQGDPLDRYCNERNLPVNERLRLFRMVCSAVEYAHRNLIVHRDIKPGNILVTADGIPKLLDFGIAKVLNPESEDPGGQTVAGAKLMTPDYASPEQKTGDPITTASDVYSLGVVLYVLLAGRLPRTDGVGIEKPSAVAAKGGNPQLASRLTGDLDTIVLAALRAEPDRRYSSVEIFSEDIRRYLDGLPVSAREDTWRYRAAKFVRRHTAGVAAASLVTLSVIVGFGATLGESHVAGIQKARAERRFNDVRQLAHALMFDIYDGVKELAGATKARKQILDSALTYLDSLTQESGGDPALQRELASAYQRMGEVRFHQSVANLGDTRGALDCYRKALALRQAVTASPQATADDQLGLARTYYLVARISAASGNMTESLEKGERAVGILEKLRDGSPAAADKVLIALQASYDAVGDALSSDSNGGGLGRISEAIDVHRKALVLAQGREKKYPRAVAICLIKIGNDYKKLGDRKSALDVYNKSRDILVDLAGDSTKAEPRRDVAGIASAIGDTLLLEGDGKGALAAFDRCRRISQELAKADPANQQGQMDLSEATQGVGNAYYILGDLKPARTQLAAARELIGEVTRHDPSNKIARTMLGATDLQLGQIDEKSGRAAEALQEYREGLDVFLAATASDAGNVDARLNAGAAYLRIGSALARTRAFRQAEGNYRKALEYAEPLTNRNPADEGALYTTANSYFGLGETMIGMSSDPGQAENARMQKLSQARDFLRRSSSIWGRIHNPARLAPGGFDTANLKDVEAADVRCETALAALSRPASARRN